jgi:GTP-binding protein HflX
LGGGIGTRGPGETKLEVDRRRIGARIAALNDALGDVRRQRALRRDNAREPAATLVGYTNVGKSSLLNALSRSEAYVADRPFATLDPTTRRIYLGPGQYARLTDTVGFITDLPKDLVNAFRATLEELRDADLLIHVLDASNPQWRRQSEAVEAILHELDLENSPRLTIFNKSDRAVPEALGEPVPYVSARTSEGIPELRAEIARRLLPNDAVTSSS